MNRQSNTYTIIYIIIMVVIVGAGLAWISTTLKPLQTQNADANKMKEILASVHVTAPDNKTAAKIFNTSIHGFVVNQAGQTIEGENAFSIDVASQSKQTDAANRLLPVYKYCSQEVGTKYILPLYGQGLWGPIWGYVAVNEDGSTIYGAYFSHQGETPGLGAEIEKPFFSNQFVDKHIFKNGDFLPVTVVKAGQHPQGDEDYVDGVSGGTITSKGVAAMLDNCLTPYKKFLETLISQKD
ncbi:MAG: NADH:ubiquinone reductase (Na(+)-transporting) subunit C [Clostridiales bacterium]|nr:NADH:ubiquinone reductase (Na(+)-transporting) subunit C [Clostridiales bacterium]